MRLFSYKGRPFHLGPYPHERLARQTSLPDLAAMPPMQRLSFDDPDPESLSHAMARFIGMFDVVRDGQVNPVAGEIPNDLVARSQHLKSAAYYFDATAAGVCRVPAQARLAEPIRNPMVAALAAELESGQVKTFAAGMDMIYADVLDSARKVHGPIDSHDHALVFAVEYWRDPGENEAGCDWIRGTQAQRGDAGGADRGAAQQLPAHARVRVAGALGHLRRCRPGPAGGGQRIGPMAIRAGSGRRRPGQPLHGQPLRAGRGHDQSDDGPRPAAGRRGPGRQDPLARAALVAGRGHAQGALNQDPYQKREYRLGAYPFETLTRKAEPTTYIDHPRVPRFPKRADFFARVICGDMGRNVQDQGKNAHYVMKSPIGACARRALGALILLQFGEARGPVSPSVSDPKRNADNLKGASYYLSCDAVGICAIPRWAYYSHDAGGNEMQPYHANGVNMLLDQGHETMEGCSGDDWISVAQSMRAYLRFSMLGGVIGEQIRRLGYSARVHTVLDGDVLQPPLLLLSGLGEVSRIGEVILNPFLGPRLKSGTVSTDMPMQADQPIDFGLQRFCENCNKCARECPSGAITAGPKLMYNGYEIYKSDAEKCARYRITNSGGGMCGRCMKTCPWNLEGLFADSAFRWVAMNFPGQAKRLAALDDKLERGTINPLKKWWWDIELDRVTGGYVKAAQTHTRGLQKDLKLRYEDQTLAVYPADKMPPPYPVAFPVDREEGIARYKALLTPAEHRRRVAAGQTADLVPPFRMPEGEPPVFPVVLRRREEMTADIARYEFESVDGAPLPAFDAGAHIEVIIAPEYPRQYSLAGDPQDRSRYVLGVQREPRGKGGSMLMHRAFREGKRVFVSKPANLFALVPGATRSLLFAGGIGVTPMLTMAHTLHREGAAFDFHYSAASRTSAGFVPDIESAPWRDHAHFHFKDEGGRADLQALVPAYEPGMQVYTCGSARYMDGVFAVATDKGWPGEALHRSTSPLPNRPNTRIIRSA
ncbi:MAG: 4Fe-4S dicluster domain-containing protein [Burkholderiaceae bacterium]